MEPTFTALAAARSAANATSYVTASIAPSANRLLLAWVVSDREISGTSSEATLSGGGVSTWTATHSAESVAGTRRSTWFRALTGSSPATGEVTIDFAGQSQNHCGWVIVEVTDALLTGTNGADAYVQAVTASAASAAVLGTLGTAWVNADSRALAGVNYLSSSITLTPGTGFTTLTSAQGSGTPASAVYLLGGRDADTLALDATLSASTTWLIHGIEVRGADTATEVTFQYRAIGSHRINRGLN